MAVCKFAIASFSLLKLEKGHHADLLDKLPTIFIESDFLLSKISSEVCTFMKTKLYYYLLNGISEEGRMNLH